MTTLFRNTGASLLICAGLAACGGGGGGDGPINVDYSALRISESREAPLAYARSDEQILLPLRNGVRMMLGYGDVLLFSDAVVPSAASLIPQFSTSTLQVQGVDEADAVKYDGRYIYSARPQTVPATPTTPQFSRNVLDITRTDPTTAGFEQVSKFVIDGEQSTTPLLYQLRTQQGTAEYLVAVSQNFQGWLLPLVTISALVAQPDRTTIQLLDVRDPQNVAEAWKLELDGWFRASRLVDDTLYVVSSYRPRIPDLILPADSMEKRETNERRIRASGARDLLPGYTENGGARRTLTTTEGCLIAQDVTSDESFTDLLVIAAINVRTRHVTDVNCLSTNINSVYVTRDSLYVAGSGHRPAQQNEQVTVLHKFALNGGDITYRATGAVAGAIGWSNPSYFMDEFQGDLRILTTTNGTHHLSVLRESPDRRLRLLSSLPNATRTAPIGKPGESVFAVRFMAERAYVVTFRVTDPLYVLDLHDPADPAIAGQLSIPGFSTYLQPVGPTESELLLSVGQSVTDDGRRAGVKVELFDVRDIANPQSLGSEVFGKIGSWSEALDDPHALSFLAIPGPNARYRLALPINVFNTPRPTEPARFDWTYSGLHLLEIAPGAADVPQLHLQGVIKTAEASPTTQSPPWERPDRGVLHGESVFSVHGPEVRSSLWQNVPLP